MKILGEPVKVDLFLRKATGLVKEIGPSGAFIMPWATMAASGITYYSVAVIYSYPMGSVPLAFLIVGVPTILSAGCIALMMMIAPRSAGGYVWGTRFVDPFLGWFGCGWVYWLAQVFALAVVATAAGVVFPTIFIVMGTATKFAALISFGNALQTNTTFEAVFVLLFVLILGLLSMIEIKHYFKILMVVWGLNTVGMLVSMGLFLGNNPSTLAVNWNSLWGAGSFQTITSLATKYNLAGYVASTSQGFWNDTFGIVAYIFWALTGYEGLAYLAGEVRNPRVSFLYFFMGGMIATVVWYAAITAALYNTYGNFILQYSYVYNLFTAGKLTANETSIVAPYMVAPSMPLFAGSLGGTTILQVLGAWWFWPISGQLATYLLATRTSFGMAFDRMFPAVFGDINDRTHTPIKGTLLNLAAICFWSMISFTAFGLLVSAANTSFWFALFYLIFAVSAIMVPFKRKDLWEKGTARKIFGIPDTTLLGALAAIGMLWILALSTLGISTEAWNVTVLWMGIGILVFVYYTIKLQKRGINITQLYGEIPPP